jgi:hypothetical protein
MTEAYERGGPQEVQGLMARLATSDGISNGQSADFMTLASASGDPSTLGSLLGIESATKGKPPTEPYRPEVTRKPPDPTPERSPDVKTRDAAWRSKGHGVNEDQDQ